MSGAMLGGNGSVTIHQVAAMAGVSIKTVSRVLNHEANVRPETREKVEAAIATLKYRPNPSARNLAGTHGYNIALLYDNPSPNYLMDLQAGALASCHAEGFHLILQPCLYKNAALDHDLDKLMAESRVSGVVLSPPLSDWAELLASLAERGILQTRIGSVDEADGEGCVAVDDRGAAQELVEHLIALGHRHIAIITGHPDHGASRWRYEGYCDALRKHGLPIEQRWIAQGYFSFESGLEAGAALLKRDDRPSAIFASNDDMAAAVLHVAHSLGISIPGQLSVAGFDDMPLSRYVWPSLTTVRQPVTEMSREATSQLIRMIRKRAAEDMPVEEMRCSLVIRDSTGRPTA